MAKHQPRTYDSIGSPDENLITYNDRSEAFKVLSTVMSDFGSAEEVVHQADVVARYLADGSLPDPSTGSTS